MSAGAKSAARNDLLACLPAHDFRLVEPHLHFAEWRTGEVFVRPGQSVDHVYFPVRGLASVIAKTASGRRFEVGMYGREGMGPLSAILGTDLAINEHVVQASGAAFRITRQRLSEAMTESQVFRDLLMQYVDAFAVQVGCTALSNGSDALDERLARWLLMYHDRLDTDDLCISGAVLAVMLGASPAGVAGATASLERQHLIGVENEAIRIRSREGLLKAAGASYGVPEREYRRLVGAVAMKAGAGPSVLSGTKVMRPPGVTSPRGSAKMVDARGSGTLDPASPASSAPTAALSLRAAPIPLPVSDRPTVGTSVFFQIAEAANDILIITTPDLDAPGPTILYVNPAFTRLTGYSAEEAIGKSPRMLQGPGTDRATVSAIGASLRAGQEVHEKILNFAKEGARYWLDLRIVPLLDGNGAITHFAAIERDVTMHKRRLDELEFIADRDPLTGIPNRRALLRVVTAEIEAAAVRQGVSPGASGPCLAVVDVDHFKRINDTFGHPCGDAVLLGIADRLTENARRSDMVGRIGGEEFAAWMPSVSLREAKTIAERLCNCVAREPFETPAGPVTVTVSVGVAGLQKGDDLSYLMTRADAALYSAKQTGRNRVATDLETQA